MYVIHIMLSANCYLQFVFSLFVRCHLFVESMVMVTQLPEGIFRQIEGEEIEDVHWEEGQKNSRNLRHSKDRDISWMMLNIYRNVSKREKRRADYLKLIELGEVGKGHMLWAIVNLSRIVHILPLNALQCFLSMSILSTTLCSRLECVYFYNPINVQGYIRRNVFYI